MENLSNNFAASVAPQELELRRLAKRRVGFKTHALVYTLVNAFAWGAWFFSNDAEFQANAPWGLTFGWGLGLTIHAISVYLRPAFISEDREYENLRKERGL